ncbi:hypothetical protein IPJ91_01325 [bacterium]|nr:MAG: hypothetical protein IPJ91_01325 [bacterium]
MSTPKLTAEQQYLDLKSKYPDCILFFRMGDFYEVFDNDAREMSKVLGLTLTSRDKGEKKRPMAGIPHHALNQYLGKIVNLGYKVAIAEQMEDAKFAKGIVKREVTKVVTAGTLIDEKNLQEQESNFILALNYSKYKNSIVWGLSYLELSTGEFKLIELETSQNYLAQNKLPSKIIDKISTLQPREILLPEKLKYFLTPIIQTRLTLIEEFQFDFDISYKNIIQHFKLANLVGFGIENYKIAIGAAGVILNYVKTSEKTELSHITKLVFDNFSENMNFDFATIRSLELIEPINLSNLNSDKPTTLLGVLDKTKTPMGKRLIRSWVLKPLTNLAQIQNRLDNVENFLKLDNDNKLVISNSLDNIYDIERICGRIGLQTISPKDFVALDGSISEILNLIQT